MTLHYSDTLTRKGVVEISEKYGFPDSNLVEKFVMCLEMHKRIAGEVSCIVRGGMCIVECKKI